MNQAVSNSAAGAAPDASIKETIISVVIAFVVAFVFRGFVVEPFLIPTGSMAPTLMGAHMRFTSPETGYSWAVGPWQYSDSAAQFPKPTQGGPGDQPIRVRDPMTQQSMDRVNVPRRAGDRIFVLKSVYSFVDPERFDVMVFKCPFSPQENYIKRLIGLPGEQIALVDGDIFTRKAKELLDTKANAPEAWSQPGWSIARKPERVQRSVWQPVFDSQYTPEASLSGGGRFNVPWIGSTRYEGKGSNESKSSNGGTGWTTQGKLIYEYTSAEPSSLTWDSERWPIRDFYSYNETGRSQQSLIYPVSDVRVEFAVKPSVEGQSISVRLFARRHEFEVRVVGTDATLRMRPASVSGTPAADDSGWIALGSGKLASPLKASEFTTVEFWHADQALQVWVGGKQVCNNGYDWTPAQRFEYSTGKSVDSIVNSAAPGAPSELADPRSVQSPKIAIEFGPGPVSVTRLVLARDLHYQAASANQSMALGADPRRMPTLNDNQFFTCGDNSPASLDGRLWTSVDRWVAEQVDPTIGVVNRDLLVGKAFFVYFPAPIPGKILMPDAGRLRFIW